ncbi:MAG: ribonuclease P protein component [Oligoflexus sp.]
MFSFPKQHRLLKRREFTRILQGGLKIVDPYMVILACNNERDTSRLGLIVSRKVGKAVVRNQVKRRLRESYRQILDKPKGLDLVVIARFPITEASQQQVDKSFQKSLSRLLRKMQTRAANHEC